MGNEFSAIGKSIPRVDAFLKVTGQAKYAADYPLPDLGYARVLRSPRPHARILAIDTAEAAGLPGVRAVVTGTDPLNRMQNVQLADQPILARDVVRFAGEAVACVVADKEKIAEEALARIKVEYEGLPSVFDVEEAMKPDCPVVLHPDMCTYERLPNATWLNGYENRPNVHHYWEAVSGDVDQAFREADIILRNRFSTPMAHHACLENHHIDAWLDAGGGITIRTKNKAIYSLKAHISHMFGLSPAEVRIITPYMGGDFGSSGGPYPDTLAVLLALRTRRPVRLSFGRTDNFLGTTHKPLMVTYITDGLRNDGTILAREIRCITDAGAYTGASNIITYVSTIGSTAIGTYRFPNFRYCGYGVYTNHPPAGAFRGIGMPDLNWALEMQTDIAAQRLGIDPVAFRKKKILKEGEKNCLGQVTHSIGAEECLDKVAEALTWGAPLEKEDGPWRRGKGIAIGCQATPTHPPSFVHVKVHEDATIEVHHCAIEQGQGTDTVMAQIAGEAFSVPPDKVRIASKDTNAVPFGPRTGGSRSTFYAGTATWRACQDAKRQIFDLAAARLAASPEDLETRDGRVYVQGSPHRYVSIRDLFSPMGFAPGLGEIIGKGECTIRGKSPDKKGHSERWVAFYGYGAYAVQIAVDTETGQIKVEKVAGCCDMGYPINPKMCEQQTEGAIGQGIGISLYEEMVAREGVVQNPNFTDYRLPTTMEMPEIRNVKALIGAVPHQEGPFGAKGLGEVALTPFYAAVGNAFFDATGLRIRDLPLTRERVFMALKAAGQNRRGGDTKTMKSDA